MSNTSVAPESSPVLEYLQQLHRNCAQLTDGSVATYNSKALQKQMTIMMDRYLGSDDIVFQLPQYSPGALY